MFSCAWLTIPLILVCCQWRVAEGRRGGTDNRSSNRSWRFHESLSLADISCGFESRLSVSSSRPINLDLPVALNPDVHRNRLLREDLLSWPK